jgi:3'(2'), 5'-bisphosphate nucleotidase
MPGSDVNDAHVSLHVAQQAGRLLLELREQFLADHGPELSREKADTLRDLADSQSHALIARALAEARPEDAVLSEEGKDDSSRLDAARVWIVDPLDGTWEYGQIRSDFAVHIALWDMGDQRLSACTVDLPGQGLTRSVLDADPGVHPLPTDRPIRIVASRSRPPETLGRIVDDLSTVLAAQGITQGVEVVDVGSVGAKVNEVLAGRAEAYVHNTGFYEWDVAAPYGVAVHYGLVPSHFDGSPVTFNHMPPYVTDLVVAHPDIAAALRSVLRT